MWSLTRNHPRPQQEGCDYPWFQTLHVCSAMSECGAVWGQSFPLLRVGIDVMYFTRLQLMKSCTTSFNNQLGNLETGGFNAFNIRVDAAHYVSSPTPTILLALMRFAVGRQLCPREQRHHVFRGSPGSVTEHRHWRDHFLFLELRTELRSWF